METGTIVEFIDSQRIITAVIIEIKKLRLRLLTEHGREVKISAGRLAQLGPERLDPGASRQATIEALRTAAQHRNGLAERVDVEELWEVLHSEQEWIDLSTMAALCFGEEVDGDRRGAVLRAFFKDRTYFKFNPDRFFPHTPEKVEQIQRQREAAALREELVASGAEWVRHLVSGGNGQMPERSAEIVAALKDYYLFEKESASFTLARDILKRAGHTKPDIVFKLMVQLGIWDMDVNLDILRLAVPTEFPEPVAAEANSLATATPRAGSAATPARRDLTDLAVMTIDGAATQDFDDAISIEAQGHRFRVGIHITDVAHHIRRDSPIDAEARLRGSTIYMADGKIPMVPGCLSDDLCSLKAGEERPAITTFVTLSAEGEVLDYEILASTIRVRDQLSYFDVNQRVGSDAGLQALYRLAQAFRQHRLDRGAVMITLPEINIWLDESGDPQVNRVDRESPGRFLVAEMMILANWLAARFLAERGVPAVFRSQPEPRQRLFDGVDGSLFQNWMQRRHLSRFALSSNAEPHIGLGLNAYVTATSPIRKYFDLVTQRQLRAALELAQPYSEEEVTAIIQQLERPMSAVGQVQFRRQRYWLLRHLEKQTGSRTDAMVLAKRRNSYQVLLNEYLLEANLPMPPMAILKPEDLIQVTIQHVNARKEALAIFYT
ncbi:MAG: RNB domain-containing ribonuclease [Desulfosarcinaceae bacterium]|nr:RNB domain-containing ribonuclease [Desulfosarcinaceae bacterium]